MMYRVSARPWRVGARNWRGRGRGRTSCCTKRRTLPRNSRDVHRVSRGEHRAVQSLRRARWDAVLTAMGRSGAMNTFGERPSPVIKHFRADPAAYLAEMRGPGPSPMRFEVPGRRRGASTLPVVYRIRPAAGCGRSCAERRERLVARRPERLGRGLRPARCRGRSGRGAPGSPTTIYNEPESGRRTVGRVDTAAGRATGSRHEGRAGV